MKKSKKGKKRKQKKQDHRPILIPKAALDKLVKLPTPHNTNCIALYLFYLKTAVIQKTNQIWCSDSFVSGETGDDGERLGLKWAIDRVKRTRQQLIELGYIELIQSHDKQGHFDKRYIKLKYFASKMTIEKEEYLRQLDDYEEYMNMMLNQRLGDMAEICRLKQQLTVHSKIPRTAKAKKSTVHSKTPLSVKYRANAYSNGNINAYRNGTVAIGDRACKTSSLLEKDSKPQIKKFDKIYSSKLYKALQANDKVRRKVNINKWILQFKKLRVGDGVKKKDIKKVLLWYIRHIGDEFVPVAFSAKTFREKFDNIYNAMKRSQKDDGEFEDFKVKTKQKGNIITTEIFYDD